MRLTFLGTGTSTGVPVIGCMCDVCTSSNPRNKRLRTSALLEVAGLTILIDAGPDLRQQALAVGMSHLDAVLITHTHADHIAGLDDIRPLNFRQKAAIPLYGTRPTLYDIQKRFDYAFANLSEGSTRPSLELTEINPTEPFMIGSVTIRPLPIQHGTWAITGYQIGRLGYVTDANVIPPESQEHLRNLDVLVLNALRAEPHPTHFSIAEAVDIITNLNPRRAFLVHMNHQVDYATTNCTLPEHIQLAYDGQVVDIEDTYE
ncbi:MAG: MBL fold metallo-hydrolase [Chloroflexi bacterium AL-W]|nr:MBL fold metallo-hydrolase [Chloroflexi bacterium AL-N1]NOK65593.1 MBL fold metallo-hydrolase [Chloroflexi bacterium AL-N10]NOK74466.1 MBL fold metallo-hydrolase [Chloroflexi bacterium AL-N5]NOK80626.1 MBL fold metallo-hydrolase [Chloroflexi bacterium AL-W]NOK88724.1 MBL fold metallo-hydrolase [Chloroflexi bacterium AL-N15]